MNLTIRRKCKNKALLIREGQAELVPVRECRAGEIYLNDNRVLPLQDAKLYAMTDGSTIYAYNVSLKYLEEISNLSQVEENVAIKNMFNLGSSSLTGSGGNGLIIIIISILLAISIVK